MTFDELVSKFTSSPLPAMIGVLILALLGLFTLWARERGHHVKQLMLVTKDFADKLDAKNKEQLVLATSILKDVETNSIMLRQTRELHDRVVEFLDHLEPLVNKLTGRRPRTTSTYSDLKPVPILIPEDEKKKP
jgi:hypothetical protein